MLCILPRQRVGSRASYSPRNKLQILSRRLLRWQRSVGAGYVEDVNAEEEGDEVILATCGLLA